MAGGSDHSCSLQVQQAVADGNSMSSVLLAVLSVFTLSPPQGLPPFSFKAPTAFAFLPLLPPGHAAHPGCAHRAPLCSPQRFPLCCHGGAWRGSSLPAGTAHTSAKWRFLGLRTQPENKRKGKKKREKNLLSQKRLFLLNHILKPRNIHVIETCLSYTKQQIGSEEHHGRQRGTGLPPAQSQPAARPCLQLPSSSPRSSLLVWGLLSSEVASSISQTLPSDSRCLQPALPSVPEALLGLTSPTPTS